MSEPIRDDAPRAEAGSGEAFRFLGRLRERLPKPNGDFRIPWGGVRRVFLVLLLIAGGVLLWRGAQRSFQAVAPGHVGVCVNRFTGSLATLEPGTHFRPPALYEIHAVRISDQLLSADVGLFSVTTKEGVIAKITVQARWAIDRKQLLTKWAALPPQPARELVAPVLFAAFRAVAPRYEVTKLISDKREELASLAAVSARERLAESGVVLKEVLIGDLVLPPEFEKGRIAMVDEVQATERLEVTLQRKAKEVEETRLTAQAQKARQVEEAEASAAQHVIQARGEADAMKHILELKTKQIQQKKLEAEAERESIVERAHAAAEASKIQTLADVDRRKAMADAEAYATRVTAQADFEKLEREAVLVTANPLLIPKTFADRLSDRVQVILTPSIGGEQFTGEVFKRVANGQAPLAPPPPSTAVAVNKKSN
ncbi:MAG TPA: SPFH domain-containing protein [Thermoanaerobaculia bacterium]|jgi:regulator of protease activity HflC (stomatin/prohibitin superfamily)|nr:SPFH domain-containing protein [Thermoanaerobaculia bacterium]